MPYRDKYHKETNDCMPYEPYIEVESLARAYVPMQNICKIFNETDSLKLGTIFPELYKPYVSRKAKKGEFFYG